MNARIGTVCLIKDRLIFIFTKIHSMQMPRASQGSGLLNELFDMEESGSIRKDYEAVVDR